MSYRALQGSPKFPVGTAPCPLLAASPWQGAGCFFMGICLFQAGKTEVFFCTLAAKWEMWLGKATSPRPPAPWHTPANATRVPVSLTPNPTHMVFAVAWAAGRSWRRGWMMPCKGAFPSASCPPALPCPEAAWLSLLTLPIGSRLLGLTAALILAIPWKESFSITQLSAEPSACQLCLLTRVAGVPQQHTPAPARPGLPVPAFCTPKPHTRLPSLLGTFQPGTPNFLVSWLEWATWPSCMATPGVSLSSGVAEHSTGRHLFFLPCRPHPHV